MSILEIAIKAGEEFDNSELGTLCLTPYGEEIVKTIRESSASESECVEEFKQMWLHPSQVPHELIALCMHHLKLSGIFHFIQGYRCAAMKNNDWRADSPTKMILDSYEEPWKDKELFYKIT